MRFRMLSLAILLGTVVATADQGPAPAGGQPPAAGQAAQADGAAVFERSCASCHGGQTVAPSRDALRAFSPESIVTALTVGKMAVQGQTLSAAEHRAVAEFLTGRAPATAPVGMANRCTTPTPTTDPGKAPSWIGWGNDLTNTRYAPNARIAAADMPRMQLKWAFGYAGVSAARAQPALAGGKLFVASENAEVHALDPKTGCTYWTFKADGGVRSALTVGPYNAAGRSGYALFFGDSTASVYAVDSVTGQQIWKRDIEEHQMSGITGGLVVYDNKVFVPTQGLNEEGQGGRGGYACCTFRGSLTAMNTGTGEIVWRTYIVDEPKLRGKNRTGQDAYGPAGGGIWSAPTIDVKRRSVYVATGNGYADPPQPMTDAIVAMDLDTGTVKWVNQVTPNDNWAGGCGANNAGNPGCPETQGPDHDFSASPALATAGGRQLLIVPQKSGLAYAVDPDSGKTVWQYRMGAGSGLGGQWGAAVDGERAYFGVNDFLAQNPGGMRAVRIATGEQIWSVGPPERLCAAATPAGAPGAGRPAGPPPGAFPPGGGAPRGGAPGGGAAPPAGRQGPPAAGGAPQGPPPGRGAPGARGRGGRGPGGGFGGGGGRGCSAAQGGAVTAIPGAVIGVSLDGGIRAYAAEDGKILWVFDTNKPFETVNGVMANGGGIDGSAVIVADGMLYVNSGYGGIVGTPGNVLLAFAPQ